MTRRSSPAPAGTKAAERTRRPRGRPPVGDTVRTEKVYTRCYTADVELLDAAAEVSGLDRSTALRVAMLDWARRVLRAR